MKPYSRTALTTHVTEAYRESCHLLWKGWIRHLSIENCHPVLICYGNTSNNTLRIYLQNKTLHANLTRVNYLSLGKVHTKLELLFRFRCDAISISRLHPSQSYSSASCFNASSNWNYRFVSVTCDVPLWNIYMYLHVYNFFCIEMVVFVGKVVFFCLYLTLLFSRAIPFSEQT